MGRALTLSSAIESRLSRVISGSPGAHSISIAISRARPTGSPTIGRG
jgi:hypothetical protein